MKKLLVITALFFGFSANATEETDSLGLPGDNLDLFGVLDLFKQSASLEDFEKKLNDPASEINNLDLNNDDNVDYIRVVDRVEGDAHAIVLQVPVSATESQDVAAIELEKTGTETADLQVVGDEELYGADYIVEAKSETAATDAKWQGFRPVVVVNVWMWPAVRFVYAPAYVIWVSPYRWAYYPVYWKPWRPVGWRVHHARAFRYHHAHYVCVHHHRMARAHAHYHGHRVGSPSVHQRYEGHHQRHAANQGQRNGGGQKNGTVQKNGAQKNTSAPRNGNAQKGKQQGQKQPQHKQGGQKKQSASPRGGGGKKGR